MKLKLVFVLLGIGALFVTAVLWRTDNFIFQDRMNWVEAQSRIQIESISSSIISDLKVFQHSIFSLKTGTDNFQKNKINWNSLSPNYAAASFVIKGDKMELQTFFARENSRADKLSKEFLTSVFSTIQTSSRAAQYYIKPFKDSGGGRHVAVMGIEGSMAYGLISSGEAFQALIDSQKGSLGSFTIVTLDGLVVGHNVSEYLGTMMSEDLLFKEALSSGATQGNKVLRQNGDDIYQMYERIPQSNLLALTSAPLGEAMKGRSALWWQILLLGCGFVLIGSAGILAVIVPNEKVIDALNLKLREAHEKVDFGVSKEKVILRDTHVVQQEKVGATMKVASTLAHELKGPIDSMLGFSQMILAGDPQPEVRVGIESIIRESRLARRILDKILGYAGENIKEKNQLKLEGPLVKALKELEPLFGKKGVKVRKNLQDTSVLDLEVDSIIKAIEHILNNAVEAMERMPNKELQVDLFEDTEGVHLAVADTGEGIDPKNVEKIFDPFFTTRSFLNHMGLGLSFAFGVFKQHHGEIKVKSEIGRGTKISILFKKDIGTTKSVVRDEVEILPMDLPRLKASDIQIAATESPEHVSPLEVNIDSILELPEATEKVFDQTDGAEVVEPELSKEAEQKSIPLPPIHKISKLDNYAVEIRRPGKRN